MLIEEVDGKSAFDHSKVGEILPVNLGGLKVIVKNPMTQRLGRSCNRTQVDLPKDSKKSMDDFLEAH